MRIFTNKTTRQENYIYLIVWFLLFVAPLLSVYVRTRFDSNLPFHWHDIFTVWEPLVVFLLVFLVHNYLLAPLLVYERKTSTYLAALVVLVAVFTTYQCVHRPSDLPPGPPPELMADGRPQGVPKHFPHDIKAMREPLQRPPIDMHDVVAFTIFMLMIGANVGVKQYFKSVSDRKEFEQLEKASLEQELEYLKYQINPHFFMNTLNNIHALVDIDPNKAKTSVVELSKLMRYVLYEGVKARIPLSTGVNFMNNYISLMRMRYTDKVRITINVPKVIPQVQVPPLLIIPFVENAFKHGVSYQKESFIEVHISTCDGQLVFTCRNSKNSTDLEHGGVGLTNVRKRLDLLYGDKYVLNTHEDEDTYEMSLTFPLDE